MVSDEIRNEIWQDFLDVTRLVRYYGALSDRYKRNYNIVRVLLFAAATSGIAAFLDALPPIAQLISGVGIALIIAWDFVSDYRRKAAVLHAIRLQCGELENEWRALWRSVDDGTIANEEALKKNRQLLQRITSLIGNAGYADIREDHKLNETQAADAYKFMEERYAQPPPPPPPPRPQ